MVGSSFVSVEAAMDPSISEDSLVIARAVARALS